MDSSFTRFGVPLARQSLRKKPVEVTALASNTVLTGVEKRVFESHIPWNPVGQRSQLQFLPFFVIKLTQELQMTIHCKLLPGLQDSRSGFRIIFVLVTDHIESFLGDKAII